MAYAGPAGGAPRHLEAAAIGSGDGYQSMQDAARSSVAAQWSLPWSVLSAQLTRHMSAQPPRSLRDLVPCSTRVASLARLLGSTAAAAAAPRSSSARAQRRVEFMALGCGGWKCQGWGADLDVRAAIAQ